MALVILAGFASQDQEPPKGCGSQSWVVAFQYEPITGDNHMRSDPHTYQAWRNGVREEEDGKVGIYRVQETDDDDVIILILQLNGEIFVRKPLYRDKQNCHYHSVPEWSVSSHGQGYLHFDFAEFKLGQPGKVHKSNGWP